MQLPSRLVDTGAQQGTFCVLRLLKAVVGLVFMTAKCKGLAMLFHNVDVKIDVRGVSCSDGTGEPWAGCSVIWGGYGVRLKGGNTYRSSAQLRFFIL